MTSFSEKYQKTVETIESNLKNARWRPIRSTAGHRSWNAAPLRDLLFCPRVSRWYMCIYRHLRKHSPRTWIAQRSSTRFPATVVDLTLLVQSLFRPGWSGQCVDLSTEQAGERCEYKRERDKGAGHGAPEGRPECLPTQEGKKK